MVRSPSSASTCLARALRLRGQKRVPLPPARIIGRKSIASDMALRSLGIEIFTLIGEECELLQLRLRSILSNCERLPESPQVGNGSAKMARSSHLQFSDFPRRRRQVEPHPQTRFPRKAQLLSISLHGNTSGRSKLNAHSH